MAWHQFNLQVFNPARNRINTQKWNKCHTNNKQIRVTLHLGSTACDIMDNTGNNFQTKYSPCYVNLLRKEISCVAMNFGGTCLNKMSCDQVWKKRSMHGEDKPSAQLGLTGPSWVDTNPRTECHSRFIPRVVFILAAMHLKCSRPVIRYKSILEDLLI